MRGENGWQRETGDGQMGRRGDGAIAIHVHVRDSHSWPALPSSALVSDSGSGAQPVHSDSKYTPDPILYTCFIALQVRRPPPAAP